VRFVPSTSLMSRENNVGERKEQDENGGGRLASSYEPPKLVRVTLRPEEAVLGHCKASSAPNPSPSGCFFCKSIGS
jgi:hypothetical protein